MFKLSPKAGIVLASASPRRKELLQAAGIPFEVALPDCDEKKLPGETPQQMVERLAALKARSVQKAHPHAWIIGADTIVLIDGQVLGKPADAADAERMLDRIQGRQHEVYGGIALLCFDRGVEQVQSHRSLVEMVAMDRDMIARYVLSGEPLDKAGAYAIQGIGAALVKTISGSYTNVVGINLAAVVAMLKNCGALQ